MRHNLMLRTLAVCAIVLTLGQAASAAWDTIVIRNATTGGASPVIQPNNTYVPGATEFVIASSGQKAAWGTSDIDGATISQISQLAIARLDDRTRFNVGSGPYVAPYFNLWITDGLGNFAVIGNEPSDPIFQPLYSGGYDLSYADLANKPAKVYENTDKSWLPNNGVGLTFADIAAFTIQAPSVAQLTTGWTGLTGGAPRELGTNVAYGVNWVFGDTLANYVSGSTPEGYVVANPVAAPEPASFALLGLAALSTLRRRRI